MCGILGIIAGRADRLLTPGQVYWMRDAMASRGPDGAGYLAYQNITLAHRRLAIRDVAHGKQPWLTQDGRYALVYNGELYNDDELARNLGQRGVQLRTRCDTEVLAEAWAMWGPDCLYQLRGMFAFGVVELATGRTWLVRDRFGIKPLFYSWVNGDLVFASEVEAIRRHPEFRSRPNFRALAHYHLTLRTTLGSETLFEDILTVQPAEMITFDRVSQSASYYWSPRVSDKLSTDDLTLDEAADSLALSLASSVDVHLKSDVNVGMMLSGGVDSNTLATLARNHKADRMVGMCGGGESTMQQPAADTDFEFARRCASHLSIDYEDVRLSSQDYLETWQSLVKRNALPLATPTDAVIYRVAKRLKQHCGVAIGGEGADEAFCGYAVQHWSGNDFDLARDHRHLAPAARQQLRQSLRQQYGQHEFSSISDHYLLANGLIPLSAQASLFRPEFWSDQTTQGIRSFYQQKFDYQEQGTTAERYARVLLGINLESLLSRLDSATMAASLEARVPYADHKIVEQANRLPHPFKIDVSPSESTPWLSSLELSRRGSLRSKRILRKLASGILPEDLALRPKQSFPTPLTQWLSTDWKDWSQERIHSSEFAREIFTEGALEELKQLPTALSLWKWPILNTVIWGEQVF